MASFASFRGIRLKEEVCIGSRGELFLGIVKKQNIMARNTYIIAQCYSNHGQRKTGREEKRKGGREGPREIEDQEEALLKS